MSDRNAFPACMHGLAAAMHAQQIDPATVTIELPRDKWWQLYCGLVSHYNGRGFEPHSFAYMGFVFKPRVET